MGEQVQDPTTSAPSDSPELESPDQEGGIDNNEGEGSDEDPVAKLIEQKSKGLDKFFNKSSRQINAKLAEIDELKNKLEESILSLNKGSDVHRGQNKLDQDGYSDEAIFDHLGNLIEQKIAAALDKKVGPVLDRMSKADKQNYVSDMTKYVDNVVKDIDSGLSEREVKRVYRDAYDLILNEYGSEDAFFKEPSDAQKSVLREKLEDAYDVFTNERNEYINRYASGKKRTPIVEGRGGASHGTETKKKVAELSDRDRQKGFAQLLRATE